MKSIALALLGSTISVAALAQSSPNLSFRQVPTAGQWNSYFAAKQDVLTPSTNISLGTLTLTSLQGTGLSCVQATLSGVLSLTGAACGQGGSGAVNSVSNSDGTLSFAPTTGAVVGSLALGHANTWTATQTFPNNSLTLAELPQLSNANILGNLSGSLANIAALPMPACASDGIHGLTNNGGSGFNCTSLTITNAALASMAANTTKCNNGSVSATPIDCTATQEVNMLSAAPWNDLSVVVGSNAAFWNCPAGTCAVIAWTGVVDLYNRAFIGEATKNNKNNDTTGPFSWVEGLIGGFVAAAQLSVGSTIGALAVSAYSRASDAVTASGSQNNINAQGLTGFGYNDDTTASGANFPIAVGAALIGGMKAGVTNGVAIGTQNDINNASTAIPAITPNALTPNGATMAALLTSGAYTTLATQQAGAALVVGFGRTGGPTFNAGIVIGNGTIASTTVGSLGTFPRGIELPAGYGQTWWGSGTTEVGGWFINSSGNWTIAITSLSINGTTAVSCPSGIATSAKFVNGFITSCS